MFKKSNQMVEWFRLIVLSWYKQWDPPKKKTPEDEIKTNNTAWTKHQKQRIITVNINTWTKHQKDRIITVNINMHKEENHHSENPNHFIFLRVKLWMVIIRVEKKNVDERKSLTC